MADAETVLSRARTLADELLRPNAEQVDAQGVPRSQLDELARAGLFGVTAPTEAGGSDLAPPAIRELVEILAGADASTWFVWTQHHTPVRTLVRGSNDILRQEALPQLASGEWVAGVAYTHLRRAGPPPLVATSAGDGWRLDGRIDWLTSWGLADTFLVGAQCNDDVVWCLLPLQERAGVAAAPLRLAAMGGTFTVSVALSSVEVRAAEVVLVERLQSWRATDRARTSDVSPAVVGLIAEAARRLRERGEPAATRMADVATAEMRRIRTSAYDLIDSGADDRLGDRLALRAEAHELACRTTAALVAAGAGRSMLLDAAAQRLAREALFLLVQGQTAAVREATLDRLAGPVSD